MTTRRFSRFTDIPMRSARSPSGRHTINSPAAAMMERCASGISAAAHGSAASSPARGKRPLNLKAENAETQRGRAATERGSTKHTKGTKREAPELPPWPLHHSSASAFWRPPPPLPPEYRTMVQPPPYPLVPFRVFRGLSRLKILAHMRDSSR